MAYRLSDLLTVALIFVVSTIGISIGADVVNTIQDDQTSGSYAYNVSGNGLIGLDELGGWIPTLAIVVAAALIITTLVGAFAMGRR